MLGYLTSFFMSSTTPKLVDLAKHNLEKYYETQLKRINIAYSTMTNNLIYKYIDTASKKGQTNADLDFDDLNKSGLLGNHDILLTPKQLDQLIFQVIEFVKNENLNYTLNGTVLTLSWDDLNILHPQPTFQLTPLDPTPPPPLIYGVRRSTGWLTSPSPFLPPHDLRNTNTSNDSPAFDEVLHLTDNADH
jgi:hypothetical protein